MRKSIGRPAGGASAFASRVRGRFRRFLGGWLATFAFAAGAAEVDVSKLPPPATNTVEFARDIQPIFERACYRCHGPERPKSDFRLDTREALLRGGSGGVAVVPGESARSPLIHYVAGLVEDMEMPPAGKGDPLTATEIGLLRAWIDQGAPWGAVAPASPRQLTLTPTVGWITVSGDERKFREHFWQREGWDGGLADFSYREELEGNRRFLASGRLLRDDYKLSLALEQPNFGFARAGFEQYRKYYDDSGGFYRPFPEPAFDLGRDLYLDLGKAWVEFGLTRPDLPWLTLGYEYHFREGAKSMLHWGDSTQGGETRKIYPSAKDVDEALHVLRFDIGHEWRGWRWEDNFRAEFYDLETSRQQTPRQEFFSAGPEQPVPGTFVEVNEKHGHFQGVNTLRLEKQFREWLLVSGGYLYSRLDDDAGFRQSTFSFSPTVGDFWHSRQILLDTESHVFNVNSQLGPWEGLTFAAGLQNEWSRQRGVGEVNLDVGFTLDPPLIILPQAARLSANLDRSNFEESFVLRFTKIPHTVLYAEARFRQEWIGQFEEQASDPAGGTGGDFLRDTDAANDMQEYRAGFNVSPWQKVALSAHYRLRRKAEDYDHRRDEPNPTGYSAFIRRRETDTDEVEAKLAVRPARWLKTTFGYKVMFTDYTTATDAAIVPDSLPPFDLVEVTPGGAILAGNYDAHVYSLNATITPWRRFYLNTTFSFTDSRLVTAQNGSPAVAPYRGDIYSVVTSGNFVLNERTDLHAGYFFSRADFAQDHEAGGLPLGIQYERHGVQVGISRRFRKNLTTNLQYGYFWYDEPTAGGRNDYRAHAVFASLSLLWP